MDCLIEQTHPGLRAREDGTVILLISLDANKYTVFWFYYIASLHRHAKSWARGSKLLLLKYICSILLYFYIQSRSRREAN